MAIRAFSRSRIPIFASMLLRDLVRVPIKESLTHMKSKTPVIECDSCKPLYGLRQYHDGRPRGPLWRGKKLIGKEALFVILGLKRFKDDEEKLDKFIKTHVLRLLKMDMIAVLLELERQEEVTLAVKVFRVIQKQDWYRPDVYLYKDLIIALARCRKMDDAMQLWENMRKEDLFPDSQAYTEVIRGFLRYGSPADAMNIYEDMKNSPDPPEELPFRILLKGLLPHPLLRNRVKEIQDLDCEGVYPVVQWIVNCIQTLQEDSKDEVTYTEHSIEDEEHTLRQLVEEWNNAENSLKILNANMNEQNQRKVDVLNEMQHLRERINKEGANTMVLRLVSLLELLKELERQESDFQSHCNAKRSELQAEVIDLEGKTASGNDSKNLSNGFDHSLCDSLEKLNSAKRELAARLRAMLLLKRQLDDVPSQSELIQYERRFSELYVHIQEKLRQTRKYYATYNALLEIKELMLKETSLLNSISSQFQDAITSTAGRMKLIDSMEGIVKGTQQKLEKVQLGLQAEQKVCDALKERYAAAIAEQRHCYSLLKAFKEECAKNEMLRSQTSA